MAGPQPETPLSNNMYTALDSVGHTQLAHVGGYRDKSRLGAAMGNSGKKVRIGASSHYAIERLRSRLKSPYIHYKYPAPKESIGVALHKQKIGPKGTVMPLHAPLRAIHGS